MKKGCGPFVFPPGFASTQDHSVQVKETRSKGTVGFLLLNFLELPKAPY